MTSPFSDIDALVGSVARILATQGNVREVQILATAQPTLEEGTYDNWNGGTQGFVLVLAVPSYLYAQIDTVCEALEDSIKARAKAFFRSSTNEYLEAVR